MRASFVIAICSLGLLPASSPAAPDVGTVTGEVIVVKDGQRVTDPRDVWVYLRPEKKRGRRFAQHNQQITQTGYSFTPHVRVIPVRSKVEFPNADNDEHNVFSPFKSDKPGFDLGRYASGSKGQAFLDVGEYDIFCNIHSNMTAKVKVVDSEWIAEVKNGSFKIPYVPAGTYELVAWTPDSDEVKQTITVTRGEQTTASKLKLQAGPLWGLVKEHTRIDGSKYPNPGYGKPTPKKKP